MTDIALLPDVLPVFPLPGVILLPRGRLPLNVFEPRYLAMVEDALAHGRMIGMVQPARATAEDEGVPLYQVGCVGRITSFSETDDGRFLISLFGVARFRVKAELPMQRGYRRIQPDYTPYAEDQREPENSAIDRARLVAALRPFFKLHSINANWDVIQETSDDNLLGSLTMICPFAPSEKQALLEAPDLMARGQLLTALLEMAALNQRDAESAKH